MNKRSFALATLTAVLALAGCASHDGVKPQAQANEPASVASQRTLSNAPHAAWPAAGWWKAYQDPQLDALIEQALEANPNLAVAQARVRKAQADAALAGAPLKPRIDGNASIVEQRFSETSIYPPPFAGSWDSMNQATIDFHYEFDFWGRNHAALRAALGDAQAAEVDAIAARLMLSVAVAQAYFELQRDYAQRDVAQATLDQRTKLHDLTAQRFEAGLDSRVELKQVETGIPAARELIARYDESIEIGRNKLSALVGAGPDRGLELARPQARPIATGIPSTLPADLLGRRPDIVAQKLRIEAAGARIDEAKAAFYPNVSLSAFVGLQSIGLDKFLRGGSTIAGVGPALSLPIFDGGRLRAGLAGRDADYDIAVEQYNAAIVEAVHEVADQLASLRALEARRTQQRLALASAQDAYELAVLRYREGLGNYLQVLVAETEVLTQRSLGADLDARGLTLSVNLVRALGGGYEGAKS